MARQSGPSREPEQPVNDGTESNAEEPDSQSFQEAAVGKTERPAEQPQIVETVSFTNAAAGPQDFQDVLPTAKAVLAPTLVNASIEFSTLDDDKDQKTLLTVTVVDFERVVAARVASRFGQFVDHTESGPLNLQVLNASARTSLQRGAVTIRIDPEGDDTWKFNFFLLLTFSDGSTLQAAANHVGLSDANGDFSPELTVGIGGIVP
jgi:hypothetical protein